jgi:hypothetical protein
MAWSAHGVKSRKLSNVRKSQMGNQNVLSRAPPCFGRQVMPFPMKVEVPQTAGRQNYCLIFITT